MILHSVVSTAAGDGVVSSLFSGIVLKSCHLIISLLVAQSLLKTIGSPIVSLLVRSIPRQFADPSAGTPRNQLLSVGEPGSKCLLSLQCH